MTFGRWRFWGLCERETDNATITAERVNENEGGEGGLIPTRLHHQSGNL